MSGWILFLFCFYLLRKKGGDKRKGSCFKEGWRVSLVRARPTVTAGPSEGRRKKKSGKRLHLEARGAADARDKSTSWTDSFFFSFSPSFKGENKKQKKASSPGADEESAFPGGGGRG